MSKEGYHDGIYEFMAKVSIYDLKPPENLITFTCNNEVHYAEIIERCSMSPNETNIKARKLTYEEFMQKYEAAIIYTI